MFKASNCQSVNDSLCRCTYNAARSWPSLKRLSSHPPIPMLPNQFSYRLNVSPPLTYLLTASTNVLAAIEPPTIVATSASWQSYQSPTVPPMSGRYLGSDGAPFSTHTRFWQPPPSWPQISNLNGRGHMAVSRIKYRGPRPLIKITEWERYWTSNSSLWRCSYGGFSGRSPPPIGQFPFSCLLPPISRILE